MGVEDVHIGRARSKRNFDNDEAEEGKEDSNSGEADLEGERREDIGDSGDFNDNGSFEDSEG